MEESSAASEPELVPLTGATGYVSGSIASLLLNRGYRVRCLMRAPEKLKERPWRRAALVEVVQDDLSAARRLAEILRG